jgi:methylenetetrahydrofolate dehydrogenase (NADP+)/methenyltetrahydrofolate cyclohydrolase
MTKLLNGRELADFIKNRQLHEVRSLVQSRHIQPKLAILTTSREPHLNPVIETYMRLKQRYADDIGLSVELFREPQNKLRDLILTLNSDSTVHGIIIQLPIEDPAETDEIYDLVAPEKDVDALGARAVLDPATPMAINWLLASYAIDLQAKNIVIVGNGKLVGKPLAKMWRNSGLSVSVLDEEDFSHRNTFHDTVFAADIIVSATGVPNLLSPDMIKPGAVVVDAGTAAEHGKIIGDLAPDVRNRADLTITPEKGGVGPLTICALFDNVLRAARNAV